MNRRLLPLCGLLACALAPRVAVAQAAALRYADSLVLRGQIERAESVYYAEARRRPRDPQARASLGSYLIGRGAVKIGVTLLEEALQFGGDPVAVSRVLAPGYRYLNDYAGVAKLPASDMTDSQKRRNAWLMAHPTRAIAPDSMLLVALARPPADSLLGVTPIRLNGSVVRAVIQPRTRCRISLSDASPVVAKLRRFSAASDRDIRSTTAVADSVGLGRATITNVPVEIESLPRGIDAVLCLGQLMPFAPTFDQRAGLVTLRMSGTVSRSGVGASAFPFYDADGTLRIARAGGLSALTSPELRALLGESRWTLDTRRGQIAVEPQRP